MDLSVAGGDRRALSMSSALQQVDAEARAFWLAQPEDVIAGIFEEIEAMVESGTAELHWAWPFVAPALDLL